MVGSGMSPRNTSKPNYVRNIIYWSIKLRHEWVVPYPKRSWITLCGFLIYLYTHNDLYAFVSIYFRWYVFAKIKKKKVFLIMNVIANLTWLNRKTRATIYFVFTDKNEISFEIKSIVCVVFVVVFANRFNSNVASAVFTMVIVREQVHHSL